MFMGWVFEVVFGGRNFSCKFKRDRVFFRKRRIFFYILLIYLIVNYFFIILEFIYILELNLYYR